MSASRERVDPGTLVTVQAWNAHFIGFDQYLTTISCFTRLADKDEEWFLAEKWHTIPPLRGDTEFYWGIRQLFQHFLDANPAW